MSASSLGQSILVLTTNLQPLRQGLAEARAETLRNTETIKRESRIQYQVDLQRLKTDFNNAERAAREASVKINREATFTARMDLAKFQSDLRTAEREQAASLRRMAQEQKAQGNGGLGAFLGSITTPQAAGALAVTAGTALAANGLREGVRTTLEYNAAIESARAQILGFTNDQRVVAQVTALANKAVAEGRGTFSETYQALADLTPLARTYNADLGELLKTAQILAAVDPAQGFEGASVALREALSGDFTSLTRRFEIPRAEIARLKSEGVPNLEIVKRALAGLGISESVLTTQAQTFNQQLKIAADEFRRFIATTGAPIFDLAKSGLGELRGFFSSKEVQEQAQALQKNLAALRDELNRPETQAGLRVLADGLGEAAETAAKASNAFGALGGGTLVKFAQGLGVANGAIEKLTGSKLGFLDVVNGIQGVLLPATQVITRFNDAYEKFQRFRELVATPARTSATAAPDNSSNPIPGNADPEYDPGKGSALFDQGAVQREKDKRERAAFIAGQAELRAYVQGFTQQQFAMLGPLEAQLQAGFDRLYGSLDKDQQIAKGLGNIPVIAARIVADIQKYGAIQAETAAIARQALGDEADAALAVGHAYEKLIDLQNKLIGATNAAAVASGNLAVVRGAAAQAEATAQKKIAALQARAAANATAAQNEARALQEGLDAVGREADRVSRGYDEQLRGLQNTLSAISRAADEAQRGFAEQSRIAQAEQQAAQEAASRNAAAYAAVLGGTTEEYRRQNEALSEQERRILALGDAALTAALKAKTAQDDKVQGLEVQQRAQLLALEERIRAARSRGGSQGELAARQLEAERDRLKAQSEYQLQLERQRAAVRGDEANTAKKPVEDAAAAQAVADKKAVDVAGERVSAIQEQARLRAEADRAAQQAIQDQITGVQEQAREAAEMYADRQRGIQEEIRLVGVRARDQAVADQAAIDGATVALGLVKKIEEARVSGAKLGADNAQRAANLAKSEYDSQMLTLGILGQQNTVLNERLRAFQDFIDKNPGILANAALNVAGGAQGGARDNIASGLNPDGTPKGPATPAPAGGYTGKGASLRAGDFARTAYTPLPSVPTPAIAPIRFTVPAPSSLGIAAFVGGGVPAFARAGGQTINNFNAPLTSFPDATIRETVEVEKAIRGGADLALRLIQGAQIADETGGGTLVRGR